MNKGGYIVKVTIFRVNCSFLLVINKKLLVLEEKLDRYRKYIWTEEKRRVPDYINKINKLSAERRKERITRNDLEYDAEFEIYHSNDIITYFKSKYKSWIYQ